MHHTARTMAEIYDLSNPTRLVEREKTLRMPLCLPVDHVNQHTRLLSADLLNPILLEGD